MEHCAPNEAFHLNGYAFTFDACAIQGERPYMEDRWCAVLDEEKGAFVLAVYDGHGGATVSSHLSTHLAREVLDEATLRSDTEGAMKRAFKRVDDVVCRENPSQMRGMFGRPGAGSTAIMALIMPPKMYVANVGDSRATAYDARGRVTFESKDQRPCVKEEKERIHRDGGFVKRGRDGMLRTGGILAVSRAFGNAGIKQFLSVEPEVYVVDLDTIDSLILCSDGLTDVMGANIASETMRAAPVGVLASSPSPVRTRRVANSLVTLARVRQSKDNISAIVLQARKLSPMTFPALETPVSDAQVTCGTPQTLQYNPASADVKDGEDAVLRVALDFAANNEGVVVDLKVGERACEDSKGVDDDGLSSPVPSAMRESTQAITPIIHASG